MVTVKMMIKNKCEEDRTLATRIAKLAGYSNPTSLYKFLNDEEREADDIECVIKIIRELFPNREFELMDQYIRTLKPNKQCARQALEYTNINKLYNVFEYLLEELTNCSNKESQEWAKVYQIDYDAALGKLTPIQAINVIDSIKTNYIKTEIFKFISKMYAYYEQGKVNLMNELFVFMGELTSKLDDDFVSNSYRGRIALTMMEVKLYNNGVEETRTMGYSALKNVNNQTINCMINLTLGNSFIFENFDTSLQHLSESYRIAQENKNNNGIIQSTRSLSFLHNYWNKDADYLNNSELISDIHENAFYLIRKGNIDKASNILNNMDLSKLNSRQLGFHFFYLGLIEKDLKTFRKSVKYFNQSGEKFFIKASLIELKKLGEDEDILEIYSL